MTQRRRWAGLLAVFMAAVLTALSAPAVARAAALDVHIDLSAQSMTVSADGRRLYNWPVSTARRGYRTPTGTFGPVRLERVWYSTIYHHSPMPYSIFFRGGFAIHGTYETKYLGHPASHGCVRLYPDNARRLFELVQSYGKAATVIRITP